MIDEPPHQTITLNVAVIPNSMVPEAERAQYLFARNGATVYENMQRICKNWTACPAEILEIAGDTMWDELVQLCKEDDCTASTVRLLPFTLAMFDYTDCLFAALIMCTDGMQIVVSVNGQPLDHTELPEVIFEVGMECTKAF